MPRFLVEVGHDNETSACARAVRVFLASGSHFLTHADWGCLDGVHSAWITVDADDRHQALALVPPAFRSRARIVGLNQFTLEQVDAILDHHRRTS
ncbi:MAG TPA: hypothetical protein VFR85_15230 [Anaeromyxobacteraceae bacterium]|nr:hypothetical protein [Anaeromyxobacteraceae bacterium]